MTKFTDVILITILSMILIIILSMSGSVVGSKSLSPQMCFDLTEVDTYSMTDHGTTLVTIYTLHRCRK